MEFVAPSILTSTGPPYRATSGTTCREYVRVMNGGEGRLPTESTDPYKIFSGVRPSVL